MTGRLYRETADSVCDSNTLLRSPFYPTTTFVHALRSHPRWPKEPPAQIRSLVSHEHWLTIRQRAHRPGTIA